MSARCAWMMRSKWAKRGGHRAKMSSLAELIREGKYQAGLLGQADLAPLEPALEASAQRAQQLADQTKQAVDEIF